MLITLQDGILQYIITEKVGEMETYCKTKPTPNQITYAEVQFENNKIIINKIKCDTCYCEPYLKE